MSNYSGEKRYQKDGEKRYQKDGEKKHCVEKSRRHNGEITKCTAAAKGKCNRKDCKFAPCCYKNGKAAKLVDCEEKGEIYYTKSSDRTYGDYDSYVQPANTGYLLPIYTMSNEEYYMQEQLTNYYYGITTIAPVAAAVAPVAAAVAPVVVAPAPVTPGSFTFTQADFARFMMLFNVNCRDLNKLTEMFPEFAEYITKNQDCFYANINHFINVINGSVPLNTAAVWVQEVFNRGYLNIDAFKGGKCGEANIRELVHFGIYNVFKTFHTRKSINDNTFVGLVICDFACRYVIQNNIEIVMPSFADINSKVTSEVFSDIY